MSTTRAWPGAALVAALALGAVCCAPSSTLAADPAPPAAAPTAAVPMPPAATAELVIANRRIFTMRATNEYGATPAVRVEGVQQRAQTLIDAGGPMALSTLETPQGTGVLLDGNLLFRVLPGDVNPEAGETVAGVARTAVGNLQLALRDVREGQDSHALLAALGKTLVATVVLVVLLWLDSRAYAAAARRLRGLVQRRSATMMPAWSDQVVGGTGLGDLAVVPLKLLAWGIALLLLYQWTALVLEFFPYTRPWGEALLDNLLQALGGFGSGMLHALPGLAFVVLIFAIARFVARTLRGFFEGVSTGRIHVGWVDEATARPTGRLLTVVIWLFALVAAYPYIPGSESEAFKGIGVFVGLMMSIGASGVVNQAVSGLMLMYTRTLRPGEFVQIGDTEGTVTSVGFVTTRIETLRNVEVNVPNAVITGNVTRNYSRLVGNGGMRLATSVTIGYDTPWRQVRAMLLIAADRTSQIARDPPPRVLQTALQDFYVEYTVVVSVADPRRKLAVLDELHAHVQDVFNEHGVQIMSPNYEADPADKKVVPREQWYAAPAEAPKPVGTEQKATPA
ncbi:MAG TPA: mechanosensitive ion channel family protein [Steroidobacteraceae bacterium]|nr:mechanosensitive ion channel family protein [Steroidobacteraceae bacterium]